MGDPLKKAQSKNFKKARDKAIEEAKQQSLVQRATCTNVEVTITPVKGQKLLPNEPLILIAGEKDVDAIRGHERVGVVDGEAAETIRRAMSEAGTPHGVQVTVLNVADLSGVGHAQINTK